MFVDQYIHHTLHNMNSLECAQDTDVLSKNAIVIRNQMQTLRRKRDHE